MWNQSTHLSLLQRVRDRSQEAWDRLVFLYSPLVDSWCRSWGAQPADVEDIRQEVFQAMTTGIESFRRDRPGDTFRGWLRVVARRKFIDYCRRKEREPQGQGGSNAYRLLLESSEPDKGAAAEPSEEVKRLHHRALELIRSQFEEQSWKAFWHTAAEGRSPVDVGEDMGMSAAAVRQAKSRILRRLKEEFSDLLE